MDKTDISQAAIDRFQRACRIEKYPDYEKLESLLRRLREAKAAIIFLSDEAQMSLADEYSTIENEMEPEGIGEILEAMHRAAGYEMARLMDRIEERENGKRAES